MKFTDKFLKVPIRVVSRKSAEMGVEEKGEDTFMMIYPNDISRYYPCSSDDEIEDDCVKVEFKGTSECVVVYETIQEFENRLNKFHGS